MCVCELFIVLLVITGDNLNCLGLYSLLLLESGVICGRPDMTKYKKIEHTTYS